MIRIKSITLTDSPERAIRVEISNGNAYTLKGNALTIESCPNGTMGWNDQRYAQMVSNAFWDSWTDASRGLSPIRR